MTDMLDLWNKARYYLALLMVVTWPPGVFFWFLLHPFVKFWRKRGLAMTYTFLIAAMLAMMWGLWQVRRPLLAVDLGANIFATAAGIIVLVVAGTLSRKRRKQLSWKVLAGVPEVDPRREQVLLTDGVYARTRNPRYLEVLGAMLGWALVTNYLAMYGVFLFSVLAIYLIVLLEEKELRERFGAEYDDYCRRVPRFLPRRQQLEPDARG